MKSLNNSIGTWKIKHRFSLIRVGCSLFFSIMLGDSFTTLTTVRTITTQNSYKSTERVYKSGIQSLGFVDYNAIVAAGGETSLWCTQNRLNADEDYTKLRAAVVKAGVTCEARTYSVRRPGGQLRFGTSQMVTVGGKTNSVFLPLGNIDEVVPLMGMLSSLAQKWLFDGGADVMGTDILMHDHISTARIDAVGILRLASYNNTDWIKKIDDALKDLETGDGVEMFGMLCVFASVFDFTVSSCAYLLKVGAWRPVLKGALTACKTSVSVYARSTAVGDTISVVLSHKVGSGRSQNYTATFNGSASGGEVVTDIDV